MSVHRVSPDTVEISVPASPSYGATLRLVASAIGADAGWSVDDIDDLKLAMAELLSIVVEQTGVERLCAGFQLDGDELIVRVRIEPPNALQPPDGLGATILAAVMDHVRWSAEGATLRKRPAGPTGVRLPPISRG
jgi:anti-sigma regulatory factor (Ser/Thr protein kinase)